MIENFLERQCVRYLKAIHEGRKPHLPKWLFILMSRWEFSLRCRHMGNLNAIRQLNGLKSIAIEPPHWLRAQMARIRHMPPPSVEKVKAQFEASAKLSANQGKTTLERIHQRLEEWGQDYLRRGLAPCPCQRPGYLAGFIFRYIVGPVEFKLRKHLRAKRAELKRRKIPFFDLPLI